MENHKIFTEQPELEQWKILSRYTYTSNIIRHFESSEYEFSPLPYLTNSISGSILQANDFFTASKNTSLQTSPILIYYGAINLLTGISCLITGSVPKITDHGMRLTHVAKTSNKLASSKVLIDNKKSGGLSVFLRSLYPNMEDVVGHNFELSEVFASIPDLFEDFIIAYPNIEPKLIPVETVKEDKRNLERIDYKYLNLFANNINALKETIGFRENYLNPMPIQKHCILNRKMGFDDSIFLTGLSNRKFLKLPFMVKSQKVEVPLIITVLIGLYVLCYLSRYKPHVWNPFVSQDSTGERLFIERFLDNARRYFPNMVLNLLYGQKICFINDFQETKDLNIPLTKDEIKELIKKEVLDLKISLRTDDL